MKSRSAADAAWDEALRAAHREARVTLLAGVAAFLWFWGTLLIFLQTGGTLFGLPLWFMASVVGGWLLTTAGAWWLTHRIFSTMPIEVPERKEGKSGAADDVTDANDANDAADAKEPRA